MPTSQLASAPPSSTTGFAGRDRSPDRIGLEPTHELREGPLEVGEAPAAASLCLAGTKDVLDAITSVGPEPGEVHNTQRHRRVEDDAADALGVIAHDRLREVRAVGDPEHVP